jgi:hypothetical protein
MGARFDGLGMGWYSRKWLRGAQRSEAQNLISYVMLRWKPVHMNGLDSFLWFVETDLSHGYRDSGAKLVCFAPLFNYSIHTKFLSAPNLSRRSHDGDQVHRSR